MDYLGRLRNVLNFKTYYAQLFRGYLAVDKPGFKSRFYFLPVIDLFVLPFVGF